MDWRDWGDEKFPISGDEIDGTIDAQARRIGNGVIVGFQFAWTEFHFGEVIPHKGYWCMWPIKSGERRKYGEIRVDNIDVPPAFISLFPLMYIRPNPGVIPLIGLTDEEWSALWEG